jgi:dGTPase
LQLESEESNGVGARFLRNERPSLEAQLCNLADEIAYNSHDIDDGVRSGLITLTQLQEVPLFDAYRLAAQMEHPDLATPSMQRRLLYEAIRRMLSAQVYDVIDTTKAALHEHAPAHPDEVRKLPVLVSFSGEMRERSIALKRFLFKHLYRHPRVMETTGHAQEIVRELFDAYLAQPQEMKAAFTARALEGDRCERARAVSDFIAVMTDRFAIREHERLTGRRLLQE